jgi:hypothetical protein
MSYSCVVCFDEITTSTSISRCSESHICFPCLMSYLESEINQAHVDPKGSIKCFCGNACSTRIPSDGILHVLFSSGHSEISPIVEKYHQFRQNAEIAADSKKHQCSNCGKIASLDKYLTHKAICGSCDYVLCSLCGQQHSSYFTGCSQSDDGFEVWKSSHGGKCKKCPNCRHHIEKNGGCNHMTCSFCEHEFCWLCKSPYGSGGCSAKLLCPMFAMNKSHRWGHSSTTRAVTKSLAYPVIGGVVCTGVCIGVGVTAVTVLPYYGVKTISKIFTPRGNG